MPASMRVERGIDVGDRLASLRRQHPIEIALDDHRVALATLVVELHIAHLAVLDQARRFVLEPRGPGQLGLRAERADSSRCALRNFTSKSFV